VSSALFQHFCYSEYLLTLADSKTKTVLNNQNMSSSSSQQSLSHFSLKGRVALITGGGQAIGRGIALRLAAAGAKVTIFDINATTAEKVAKEVNGIAVVGNVTVPSDVQNAVEKVRKELGPIDILVNNAGIVGKSAPLWELEKEDLEQVMAVNVTGPFLMMKAVIGDMIARKYGRIINIASVAGKEGNPNMVPYSASKAALICMTKAFAKEVVGKGNITVNSISPAVVRTPILDTLPQSTIDYMISKIPMGRTGTIEEVAAMVHFLASEEASFTTGQCLDISGGRSTY